MRIFFNVKLNQKIVENLPESAKDIMGFTGGRFRNVVYAGSVFPKLLQYSNFSFVNISELMVSERIMQSGVILHGILLHPFGGREVQILVKKRYLCNSTNLKREIGLSMIPTVRLWSHLSRLTYKLVKIWQEAGIFDYFDQHDITQIRQILADGDAQHIQRVGQIVMPADISLVSDVGVACLFQICSGILIVLATFHKNIWKNIAVGLRKFIALMRIPEPTLEISTVMIMVKST